MQINSYSSLSDSELVNSLGSVVQKHRALTCEVLMHLAEFDRRKLYLGLACPSLFLYCVERLHFSESEAYKRINATRAAQKYPLIYDLLAQGQLHLSAIVVLGPHLNADNHQELLRAACHKSRRLVEKLIAIRFPKADVQTSLRKVPVKKDLKGEMTREGLLDKSTTELGKTEIPALHIQNWEQERPFSSQRSPEPVSYVTQKPGAPPVTPLSEHRYQLKVTVSASTRAKLLQAQNLMRHSNPTGDVETILDNALSVLVQELEAKVCAKPRRALKQTRCKEKQEQESQAAPTQRQQEQQRQATPTPQAKGLQQETPLRIRPAKPPVAAKEPSELSPEIVDGLRPKDQAKTKKSRYIPREVRREVMQRDGLQCSFQDPEGQRCQATSFLQLHHVQPFACGGAATADNLKVFCSAHNQYQGRLDFGEWFPHSAET